MGRRAREAEAAHVASVEQDFEAALKLFVAHAGGDISKVTVGQREKFDESLADFAAHTATAALGESDDS